MTKTQTTVLETIKQNPGIHLGTISHLTGIREMHVTNAAIKLEQLGIVKDEHARWYAA